MGTIKAYKAFDKNWKCREFQFAVGFVGEDGIEEGLWYRADNAGKLVPA